MTRSNKKSDAGANTPRSKRIIRLDDLDWTEDVVGGSAGKMVFGEPTGDDAGFDSFLNAKDGQRKKGSL